MASGFTKTRSRKDSVGIATRSEKCIRPLEIVTKIACRDRLSVPGFLVDDLPSRHHEAVKNVWTTDLTEALSTC